MVELSFKRKVEIIGADDTNLTCASLGEDHILGNAFCYMLMRHPDVKICGDSIVHHSENVMNPMGVRACYTKAVAVFLAVAVEEVQMVMKTIDDERALRLL